MITTLFDLIRARRAQLELIVDGPPCQETYEPSDGEAFEPSQREPGTLVERAALAHRAQQAEHHLRVIATHLELAVDQLHRHHSDGHARLGWEQCSSLICRTASDALAEAATAGHTPPGNIHHNSNCKELNHVR